MNECSHVFRPEDHHRGADDYRLDQLLITGLLNTRLGITNLLAGVLTMIMLYSINLRIMGRPNLSLLRVSTATRVVGAAWSPLGAFSVLAFIGILTIAIKLLLDAFLRTEIGFALRATGDSERMITAQGVNTNTMKILGLALSNGLVALSGAGLRRLGARGLLALGVLAGGVRWTVCGLVPGSDWILFAQLLHGVVVMGLVIGAPLYVDAAVPERLRSTGQGVLAMAGVSLGGISSNLATGWLLEHFGADAPYIAGGVGALALGILVPLWLPPARRPASDTRILPGVEGPG